MSKKVSVIMALYNDESYVHDAIESILKSTFTNFELIICDDCSTDSSGAIAKVFTDPRIAYIKNERTMRAAAARNECLKIATGEYVMIMDSDDVSTPERMARQVEFLDYNPNFAFIGGNAIAINEAGKRVRNIIALEYPMLKDYFYSRCYLHPTIMLRRTAIQDVGGYTEGKITRRGQDLDLWFKLYEKGYRGKNLNEIFLYYRESVKISRRKRKFKFRVNVYRLLCYWKRRLHLPFKYNFYCIRPILIGFIPHWLNMYLKPGSLRNL
jgi:glycosyltransferase EpsE